PFPIRPAPTVDEIREAIRNLKDSERRLIDELFWFWPEEFQDSQSDVAIQALTRGDSKAAAEVWTDRERYTESAITAKHNLALLCHICAVDWENYSLNSEVKADQRETIDAYWKGAFARWENLIGSDKFWQLVQARVLQLNEPNLSMDFVQGL